MLLLLLTSFLLRAAVLPTTVSGPGSAEEFQGRLRLVQALTHLPQALARPQVSRNPPVTTRTLKVRRMHFSEPAPPLPLVRLAR